jgi:hypothetical protein
MRLVTFVLIPKIKKRQEERKKNKTVNSYSGYPPAAVRLCDRELTVPKVGIRQSVSFDFRR